MTFSEALNGLKDGKKIKRNGWNGKNQYVAMARMKECVLANGEFIWDPRHDNAGSNFLMFVGTSGYECGWLASQADMLADDWEAF